MALGQASGNSKITTADVVMLADEADQVSSALAKLYGELTDRRGSLPDKARLAASCFDDGAADLMGAADICAQCQVKVTLSGDAGGENVAKVRAAVEYALRQAVGDRTRGTGALGAAALLRKSGSKDAAVREVVKLIDEFSGDIRNCLKALGE